MSLDLHHFSVTLIARDMPQAAVQVPAGFPSPSADDLEDTVDPMKWVVRHEPAAFWWQVLGYSLEAESILDGDLIAVDRAERRRSGRIVLAMLFEPARPHDARRKDAHDAINDRFGKKTMVLARVGFAGEWRLRADHRLPRYSSRISELPIV